MTANKFVPRIQIPFPGVKSGHSFGNAPVFELEPSSQGERLFAFTLASRAQPRVFDFAVDEAGLQSLANLIRSEEVIEVVQGRRAKYELASVVEVSVGDQTHQDKMKLPRSF